MDENVKKEDSIDVKEAIKQAMAEIKAEQVEKEASEIDVKALVAEAMAQKEEVKVVETKSVIVPATKSGSFEVTVPGYSRHNYSNHKGYKSNELDQAYNDGMWYKATILGDTIAKEYCGMNGIECKALTSLTGASGGYTVPEQLLNRIIVLANKYGIIRNRTNKFQATTGTMLIPKNGTETEATFTLENIEKSDSDPVFDQVEVTIKKLAIKTIIPMELIQDSVIDIISYVVNAQAWAIAKKEDTVGFYGDGEVGSGSMIGIIPAIEAVGSDNLSIVSPLTNDGTWASIVRADFNKVMGRLSEPAWEAEDVAWYCSNGFYHNVMNKVKGDGGTTIPNLEAGFTKQFMGYEVVTSSVFPGADSADPSIAEGGEDYCLFGSLKTVMAFADRMGKTIRSTSEGKELVSKNQTLLVSEQRFGLTVHDPGTSLVAGSMILLQSAAV